MEASTSSSDFRQTPCHEVEKKLIISECEAGPSNIHLGQQIVSIKGNIVGRDLHVITTYNINTITESARNEEVPIRYGLPLDIEGVIGREREVKELYELLMAAEHNKRVAITGLGGVGKTTLAYHCAHLWFSQFLIQNIAILNAETTHTFHRDIISLAAEMKIERKDRQILEIIREIFSSFKNTNILLIYDNIDSYEVVKDFLPQKSEHVYILATSQLTELKSFFICYALDCLEEQAGVELMKQVLTGDNFSGLKEEDMLLLVETLGGLPLAILQASAYIQDEINYNDSEFTINDYLQEYNSHLNESFPDDFKTNTKRTVYISLKINISKIKQETSLQILGCISYLNPDEIQTSIFLNRYEKRKLNTAIRELMKYSVIKKTMKYSNEYLIIHRLVQEVCRSLHEKHNYIPVAIALTVKSDCIDEHCEFIYPHIEDQLIIQISTDGFQEAFKSGKLLDKLIEDLQSIKLDISVIKNWNAWHLAAYCGYYYILEYFNEKQFTYEHNDWTPVHSASISREHMFYNIWNYLPKNTINLQTKQGWTALHIVSARGKVGKIKELIQIGCNMNVCDKSGNTALHLACLNLHTDAINIIINSNISTDITNINGQTALQMYDEACDIKLEDGSYVKGFKKIIYVSITSPVGEPLKKELVTIKIFKENKGQEYISKRLKTLEWWDENQEAFVEETVLILCQSYLAIRVATAYIINMGVTVQEFLNILNKNQCHPVLDNILKNCCPEAYQYKLVFLIICLVIDKIKEESDQAFDCLTHMTYSSGINYADGCHILNFEEFCNLMKMQKTDLEKCVLLLNQFILIESNLEIITIDKFVQIITHTYSQHDGAAKNISHNVLEHELDFYAHTELLSKMGVEDIRLFYLNECGRNEEFKTVISEFSEIGCGVINLDKLSALHFACMDRREGAQKGILRLIVELKVDVNFQVDGIAPIHLAAFTDNNGSNVGVLALFGVDMTLRTDGGWTALHLAAMSGNLSAIPSLMFRADVNAVNADGNSAAHLAARHGHTRILAFLEGKGVDMNLCNNKGETPKNLLVN